MCTPLTQHLFNANEINLIQSYFVFKWWVVHSLVKWTQTGLLSQCVIEHRIIILDPFCGSTKHTIAAWSPQTIYASKFQLSWSSIFLIIPLWRLGSLRLLSDNVQCSWSYLRSHQTSNSKRLVVRTGELSFFDNFTVCVAHSTPCLSSRLS